MSVIRNFIKRDLNVIVPYPLSEKNYQYMMDGLKDLGIEIHTFTLAPSLDVAQSNRGERDITEQEQDRIKHHYNIGIHNHSFGEVIDNTNQTPEETTKYILERLKIV